MDVTKDHHCIFWRATFINPSKYQDDNVEDGLAEVLGSNAQALAWIRLWPVWGTSRNEDKKLLILPKK